MRFDAVVRKNAHAETDPRGAFPQHTTRPRIARLRKLASQLAGMVREADRSNDQGVMAANSVSDDYSRGATARRLPRFAACEPVDAHRSAREPDVPEAGWVLAPATSARCINAVLC